MDTSNLSIVISLFSVLISIIFALTGLFLAKKSDSTLTSIQTQMDTQLNKFMRLIQDERKAHDAHTAKSMESMWRLIELTLSYKGDLPKEKVEEEVDEVLQKIKQGFDFNPTSVLSDQSKVGEK